MSSKCCHCGGVLRDLMFLPISRRGHFFQDSFFSNIHQDFNTAVKRVLEGWNDTDLQIPDLNLNHTDMLDRYRQLRSRNLKEENQAVTVASDNAGHKMVVDVHDFTGGDVKVKVVDEKELVVEGRVEKSGDGGSSVSIHTFRRRFSLPNHTDVNAISSAISSDGILTITAPKQEISGPKTTVIPIQLEGGSSTPKLQQQFSCESCYDIAPRDYRVPIQLENATPDNTQSKTTTVPIQIENATPDNTQSKTTTVPIQIENASPANTQSKTTTVPIQIENATPTNTQSKTTIVPIQVDPTSLRPNAETFVPQHQQNGIQESPSSGVNAGTTSPPATAPVCVVKEPKIPHATVDCANHTGAVPLTNGAPSAVVAPLHMTSPSPNVVLAKPASHLIPTNVIAEETANKARSFVPVAAEGEDAADPQSLYKTKNTGKFPIKIGGININTNSL